MSVPQRPLPDPIFKAGSGSAKLFPEAAANRVVLPDGSVRVTEKQRRRAHPTSIVRRPV